MQDQRSPSSAGHCKQGHSHEAAEEESESACAAEEAKLIRFGLTRSRASSLHAEDPPDQLAAVLAVRSPLRSHAERCTGTQVANSVRLTGQVLAEDADGALVGNPGPVDSAAAVASPALSAWEFPVGPSQTLQPESDSRQCPQQSQRARPVLQSGGPAKCREMLT